MYRSVDAINYDVQKKKKTFASVTVGRRCWGNDFRER